MQDDLAEELLNRHKRGRMKEWIRRRDERGMYRLVEELRAEDTEAFKEMTRMNYETFCEILMAIEPKILILSPFLALPLLSCWIWTWLSKLHDSWLYCMVVHVQTCVIVKTIIDYFQLSLPLTGLSSANMLQMCIQVPWKYWLHPFEITSLMSQIFNMSLWLACSEPSRN